MKRLAIVYAVDGEYIRDVLSFFQLRELKRGGDREYLAVAWPTGKKNWRVWTVDSRFEVREEVRAGLPRFEEAVILALPANAERALHKKISGFLRERRVALLNPGAVSLRADDKYDTLARLAAGGIPVPESILLTDRDRRKVGSRLTEFLSGRDVSGFYVQPNEGTEGRETYFFRSAEFRRSPDLAAEVVSGLLRDRAVIVRKARGSVFYNKQEEKERGFRPVTFRVFLWQPAADVEADLGFAEVSASAGDFVTSPERGGRIVPPEEAMAHLYVRRAEGWRRLVLTLEERRRLPDTARRALAAFNFGSKRKLRIAGLDLLLEVVNGAVQPVVLEINPRPSGLDKLEEFIPGEERRRGSAPAGRP